MHCVARFFTSSSLVASTLALLVAVVVGGGCRSSCTTDCTVERGTCGPCGMSDVVSRLESDRWVVSDRTSVWKVLEEQPTGAPQAIGFVTGKDYRQESGGPSFRIFVVTTLNRRDEVGHVDQMGRAVRYEPRRGGGYEPRDVGQTALEESVAAILGSQKRVTLQPTTERRLAFEHLDKDGNGRLEKAELRTAGHRIVEGDTNRDGFVDADEFDRIDIL